MKQTKMELQKESNRKSVVIERLNARSDVKYLHKLEKINAGLEVKLKAKDKHIAQLNNKVEELEHELEKAKNA